MLNTNKENWSSTERRGGVKKRHVKRLNFGQPISQLSSVNALETGDEKVTGIGSVYREDLVQKWLDSHTEDDTENASVYPSSPVSGTYVSHLLESPVLGSRSRRRGKVLVAVNSGGTRNSTEICNQTPNGRVDRIDERKVCGESSEDTGSSKIASSPVLGKASSTSRKRRKTDETRTCFGRPLTPPKRADITSSPVTDTSVAFYERHTKRRYIDTNMNSLRLTRNRNNRLCYDSEPLRCPISQTFPVLDLFQSESKVFSESTQSHEKECLRIETFSSDEDFKENYQNSLTYYSDSEKTVSDLIEDDESQQFSKIQNSPSLPFASTQTSVSYEQEMFDNDSPKVDTFARGNPHLQISERASQATTLSNKTINNLSNPVDLAISEASSPPRVTSNIEVYANLLDSGKKRRKPRKGSLLARLHLLINREKSFLRIWQHQMKSAESDKIHVPCIIFRVEKYLTHVTNYFLEGVVMEDTFNLLRDVSRITVIVVSEVVGVLRIECGNVLKIYPPWNTLNLAGTTVVAKKLSVVSCADNTDNQCAVEKAARINVIHEHVCPCIKEDTVLPDCKELHSCVKPDALTYILES